MKESYLFDMTFNNIVFATRNKAYGAFELRKVYNKHVLTAALIATSIFAIGLGWPLLIVQKDTDIAKEAKTKDNGRVILKELILLPPPEAEPEPKQQAAPTPANIEQVRTVRNTTTRVVPDSHPGPDEAPPTQQEMVGAVIGTQNIAGETPSNLNLAGIDGEGNTGSVGTETGESSNVFDFVEEMPHFAGGEAALMRHIGKKLRYPREAISEQIEGIVIVSFVVNRNGEVTDATVLKGLGYGTDEEALRVIKSLPDWSPGKQNGKPVAVRYTLPIRFNLQR